MTTPLLSQSEKVYLDKDGNALLTFSLADTLELVTNAQSKLMRQLAKNLQKPVGNRSDRGIIEASDTNNAC